MPPAKHLHLEDTWYWCLTSLENGQPTVNNAVTCAIASEEFTWRSCTGNSIQNF